MPTLRDMLLVRSEEDRPGLLGDGLRLTWREYVAAADARARTLAGRLDPGRPPHVGVLLDNTPEMALQLAAAALGGHVLVGLNTTRRGAALAEDARRADCQLVLTDAAHRAPLPELDVPVLDAESAAWEATAHPWHAEEVIADSLFMLIFTSGTSGTPKAVRITHEKVGYPGQFLAERFGLGPDDVCYLSMPLFHSNAVMAGWALALSSGAGMALAERFSASRFLPDVRRFGATYANYVGKPLSYVLATPPRPDDADNPLRLVFGNEANERDIAAFGERFGCVVVDSYSSTENAVVVQRVAEMPPGSLGRPAAGVAIYDPVTRTEVPDAVFGPNGALVNPEQAIGELVNTSGAGMFAGYYNDPDAEAERMRGGMYWSGDLAYRDADGFVYFAGRTSDWMRVDGENLAAAPIERILLRHPAIDQAAVYAIPDPSSGDQVVAAVSLLPDTALSPEELTTFLTAQSDLGSKEWPRWVRVLDELPRTATNKVLKRELATQGLPGPEGGDLWQRAERGHEYAEARRP